MPRLVLAPEARRDLQKIRDHIGKDDPEAARRVVMRLRDLARMLATAPAMGGARPELGADPRSFVADRYLLFYRLRKRPAGIEIVRVLHGTREVDAIFAGAED